MIVIWISEAVDPKKRDWISIGCLKGNQWPLYLASSLQVLNIDLLDLSSLWWEFYDEML